jgi:hypothetical protein
MRWFNKGKQREVWDEDIQWPIGDLEAGRKIRDICSSAASSAEKIAGSVDGPESERIKHESARYKCAARIAMEIAIKISDDLLRDAAVCRIVVLCVKANDLRTAKILFRAIQAASIREDLLNAHSALRETDA